MQIPNVFSKLDKTSRVTVFICLLGDVTFFIVNTGCNHYWNSIFLIYITCSVCFGSIFISTNVWPRWRGGRGGKGKREEKYLMGIKQMPLHTSAWSRTTPLPSQHLASSFIWGSGWYPVQESGAQLCQTLRFLQFVLLQELRIWLGRRESYTHRWTHLKLKYHLLLWVPEIAVS